jgi:C4-dicarboxylate transporter DctQ subunit
MSKQKRFNPRTFDLDRLFMALLLFVMALITFGEVLARFVFQAPIAYLGELVPNLFVWMTFLGVAVAEKEDAHLGIPLLPDRFPAQAALFRTLRRTGRGIFFLLLAIYGSRITWQSFHSGEMTPLGAPAWIFTLAVPVGAALALYRILRSPHHGGTK